MDGPSRSVCKGQTPIPFATNPNPSCVNEEGIDVSCWKEKPLDEKQIYTLGVWTTKAGKEDEFITLWQSFADWTTNHMSGAGKGTLLQSADHPRRFISFGPWKDAESVSSWRQQPEFKAFAEKARELCDEFEPQTMLQVGHSDLD